MVKENCCILKTCTTHTWNRYCSYESFLIMIFKSFSQLKVKASVLSAIYFITFIRLLPSLVKWAQNTDPINLSILMRPWKFSCTGALYTGHQLTGWTITPLITHLKLPASQPGKVSCFTFVPILPLSVTAIYINSWQKYSWIQILEIST